MIKIEKKKSSSRKKKKGKVINILGLSRNVMMPSDLIYKDDWIFSVYHIKIDLYEELATLEDKND
jgi:hypothetical protein